MFRNALGRRVKQTINGETIYTVYGLDGTLHHRLNVTEGGFTDYITLGAGMSGRFDETGAFTWIHTDPLGSASAATDGAGTLTWSESYTPFGEPLQDPAANRDEPGFTGHIRDNATGLTYAQARYYNPVTARFLAPDPVGFADEGPGYFNRYAYTANDPVNFTDAHGTCFGPLALPCRILQRFARRAAPPPPRNRPAPPPPPLPMESGDGGAQMPDRQSAEDRITGGAPPDRETGQRAIWESPPTGESADEVFDDIAGAEGVEVNETGGEQGAVDVATLPDGSRVIDRNSSQGVRTIETQDRRGQTRTETRFPNSPPKERPEERPEE